MKKTLLIPTLFLTACVQMPKPNYYTPSGVSTSEYNGLYETCIKQKAPLLDDGISSANVIGRSIADACNQEYIAYSMETVSGDNQAVKNAFYHRVTNDRELAAAAPTQYVLSRRDYLNKHPRGSQK